jgi:hypothetical protein
MAATASKRKSSSSGGIPTGEGLTFEKVWAALMENREQMKETDRKIQELVEQQDRLMKENREQMKETDQLIKENGKQLGEFRESQKEANKQLGGLHNSMGDLIETLFAPHLGEKFDAYNYNLKRIYRRVPIYDDNSRLRSDIDILLSNTTVCMAVEVKRWLEKTDHVDEQIKRMQLIRQYPPAEVKGKKLLGAIVGAVVTPEAREYAEQSGFFVLELTGEDVRLLEPSKDFQPKEW